jgi:hypothetical protein
MGVKVSYGLWRGVKFSSGMGFLNAHACSAQTRTGIGLLGKPPAVKQFPPSEANRHTRLLRDPRANAGMKRTSVIEHNLYFAGLALMG